jgi:hypothetical protein
VEIVAQGQIRSRANHDYNRVLVPWIVPRRTDACHEHQRNPGLVAAGDEADARHGPEELAQTVPARAVPDLCTFLGRFFATASSGMQAEPGGILNAKTRPTTL